LIRWDIEGREPRLRQPKQLRAGLTFGSGLMDKLRSPPGQSETYDVVTNAREGLENGRTGQPRDPAGVVDVRIDEGVEIDPPEALARLPGRRDAHVYEPAIRCQQREDSVRLTDIDPPQHDGLHSPSQTLARMK
jgi:hypothetical protein